MSYSIQDLISRWNVSEKDDSEELLPDFTETDIIEGSQGESNSPPPIAIEPIQLEAIDSRDLSDPSSKTSHISSDLRSVVSQFTDPNQRQAVPDRHDLLVFDEAGTHVAVRITTRDANSLLPALKDVGFEAIGIQSNLHFVEGFVPISAIPQLESLTDRGLLGVLPVYKPITNAGAVTSQADFIHETNRVRSALPTGFDGTGVRVGVMSDSYNNLGGAVNDILSGDLPTASNITVLRDLTGGGSDEGRAMMQLVHDLAPGSPLAFSSVFFGEADFAQQIRNLANPAIGNSRVLTDDVIYFTEPFFQDGIIAQAVDEVVTNRGVTYFSSAGNQQNQSYESNNVNFVPDAGLDAIVFFPGTYYDFNQGVGVDTRQRITLNPNQSISLAFQWDDPFYTVSGVDSELDLYLLDSANNIVAAARDFNTGNQTPFEFLNFVNTTGITQDYDLVIGLDFGPTPGRVKYVNFGNPITNTEYPLNSSTIFGHAAATNAQAVAAVPYFDQDNPEPFTSLGPTTILFNPDGTRKATPEIRQKPNIAAIDGTDTTFFGTDVDSNGFRNFFGTSAAAPHAAAVAALVQQANPSFTPAQVYNRLASTAEDIGTLGFDNLTGLGLINAYDAVYGPAVPAYLDFFENFEDGDLPLAFETDSTGAGRIQVTGDYGPIGTRHITMDSSRGFFNSLNELILHVDATGASEIALSFDQKEFSDEDEVMPATFTGSVNADGVALSVDGTNWYRLVSLTGANSTSTYQNHTFDLSQFAANNGLTLGADVRIKFQQFDNFSLTTDGFAFDNISVTTPPTVSISPPTVVQAEGNSGTTLYNFTVALDRVSAFPVDIEYQTDDGTATVTNNDYIDNDGVLTFLPGDPLTQTITVAVNGDTNLEPDENFTVSLINANNANLNPAASQSTGIIQNDDLNAINGTPGRDVLTGTSGNDRMTGLGSADIITGGAGSDEFVYRRLGDRIDTITDFQLGQDKLVFTELLSNLGVTAAQIGFQNAPLGAYVTLDADGAGPDIFRPYLLVRGSGVTPTTLNNPANFIF